MQYRLVDLIDLQAFHQMMESFYLATGILHGLVADNQLVSASGWQDICARFHRANPISECRCKQSDQYITEHLEEGSFVGYQCMNGLMDYASPIIVDGNHLGTIFLGQCFHEPPDLDYFRSQARELGYDEEAYLAALRKVPVISKERVEAIMTFFSHLAQNLAKNGLEHMRLLEMSAELQKSEARFRTIADYTYGWEDWTGPDGKPLWVSPAVEKVTGFRAEECMSMPGYPLPLVHPEDTQRIKDRLSEAAKGSVADEVECRVLRKDGDVAWVSVSWHPIIDSQGTNLGYRANIRDITRQKQAEEAVQKAYEDLEVRVKQRTEELARTNATLRNEIVVRERAVEELRIANDLLVQSQERNALILKATQMASSTLELKPVLEKIAGVLAFAAGVTNCDIYLMDDSKEMLSYWAGSGYRSPAQTEFIQKLSIHSNTDEGGIIREVLRSKKPQTILDVQAEPWFKNREILSHIDVRAVLTTPLIVGDQVLGIVFCYSVAKDHTFTNDEVDLVRGIVNSVALSVKGARLYEETCQKLSESQAIQRVTTALLQKLDFEDILEIICTEAQQITGATGSSIFLLEDEDWLSVALSVGQGIVSSGRIPIHKSLTGIAILSRDYFLSNKPDQEKIKYYGDVQPSAFLAVPLSLNGNVIGALDLVNKPGGFSSEDIRIVRLFAGQVALNIEHARLIQQAEQLAVLEERQRLARELHDSVTQALYSVTLYADAARMALSAGKKEVGLDHLQELRNMAREAMQDMRLLIFELHPLELEQKGLVAVLRARLAAVEERSGLQIEFLVEGEKRLPVAIEAELYKIAQECLNNVIKHAKAQRLNVTICFDDQNIAFEIRDDGAGFNPDRARLSGGMGLRGIEERVALLGGRLEIESSPGSGTRLSVVIPCYSRG